MGITGAILGDIAGMPFEGQRDIDEWQYSDYDIFRDMHVARLSFTDDTVLTLAAAKALTERDFDFAKWYRVLGCNYFDRGYGTHFMYWLKDAALPAYNSYGNGAAMRSSACGEIAKTLKDAETLGALSALPTHNHPEGIKGAQILAGCVFMAEHGFSKEEILKYASDAYPAEYQKSCVHSISELKDADLMHWDVTCQGCVPIAVRFFYEYDDFAEMMRNICRYPTDTDTIGAIAGAIFHSYYKKCTDNDEALIKEFLPADLYQIYAEYYAGRANLVEAPANTPDIESTINSEPQTEDLSAQPQNVLEKPNDLKYCPECNGKIYWLLRHKAVYCYMCGAKLLK